MIVVLRPNTSQLDIDNITADVRDMGYVPHVIRGVARTVIAAVGDENVNQSLQILENLPAVDRVIPIQKRYKLVSREAQDGQTVIKAGNATISSDLFHVVAGPCSVESRDQMLEVGHCVAQAGATLIRGGAFKPRTSPYDFQGLGVEALHILAETKAATGLPIVSEVIREADIPAMAEVVDVFQIGARNAMNYALLEAVAKAGKPVLLKRGIASTIEEWMLAAEYLAKNGNPQVILCERGIRTFEHASRNTLDVTAVAVAKLEGNLPVFVDPSHAAGRRDLVIPLAKAAIAAGADGILVEVHPRPEHAHSDAEQQLTCQDFAKLIHEIMPFVTAAGKKLAVSTPR